MIIPNNTQILTDEQKLALAIKEQDGTLIASGGEKDLTCLVESNGKENLAVKTVNVESDISAESKTSTEVLTEDGLAIATLGLDGDTLSKDSKTDVTCLVDDKLALKTFPINGTVINSKGTTCLVEADGKKQLALKVFNYGGSAMETLYGTNSITFNAKANGLKALTLFGGIEQSGTPTPTTPQDIVCNNGIIKFSTNIANVNEQTALIGYYISAQGVLTADTKNWTYQDYIPVKPSTTYSLSFDINVFYVTISEYSTADDTGFVVRKTGRSGSNTSLTITTEATTNYIRFGANIDCTEVSLEEVLAINWMLNEGDTALPYAPYSENGLYIDGTVETITDSLSNTATAEMLLGVGNIKDTQEILTGAVTRNIGIKVFDGTETFINGQNGWITEDVQDQFWDNANPYVPICSHFVGTSETPASGSNTVRVYRTSSQTGRIYFGINKTIYTSTDDFKQYLADQYANGTPVIVVYPLATATTETVTGQLLTTKAGTNTISITQASLSNLELEAVYKRRK